MLILINEAPLPIPLPNLYIYVFMHVFVSRVSAHVSSFMSLVPDAEAAAIFCFLCCCCCSCRLLYDFVSHS